jgi:HlyD family secretion protein
MILDTSSMDKPVVGGLRTSRTAKTTAIALAAIVLLSILFLPALSRWARADRAIDATTVRFGTVTRGDLRREISVQARVVAAQHPTLTSPAQGVVRVRTRAGAEIRQGDVLAIIDSVELRSALAQAESLLQSMQSELERQKIVSRQALLRGGQQVELLTLRLDAAKRNLVRYETTFREGLSNKTDFETAQDSVRIAQMELDQARRQGELEKETLLFDVQSRQQSVRRQQAATDELRRKVDELTVRAPFDGIVASLAVQDGNAVGPNQAVVTVVNLSSLELELALPEEYAAETAIGTVAAVRVATTEHQGRVTAISPEVVSGQVAAIVAFDGDRPPGLKQNQRVTTRLVFESKRGVLKVPRGPFLEAGGGRYAWVVDESANIATRREITTGSTSLGEVEIVRGLEVGEKIIVSDTSALQGANAVLLR